MKPYCSALRQRTLASISGRFGLSIIKVCAIAKRSAHSIIAPCWEILCRTASWRTPLNTSLVGNAAAKRNSRLGKRLDWRIISPTSTGVTNWKPASPGFCQTARTGCRSPVCISRMISSAVGIGWNKRTLMPSAETSRITQKYSALPQISLALRINKVKRGAARSSR